jgi:hypothetical protein
VLEGDFPLSHTQFLVTGVSFTCPLYIFQMSYYRCEGSVAISKRLIITDKSFYFDPLVTPSVSVPSVGTSGDDTMEIKCDTAHLIAE